MIVDKITTPVGTIWAELPGVARIQCVLPTGRIIATKVDPSTGRGIYYSDDTGTTWNAASLAESIEYTDFNNFCVTSTGRVLAGTSLGEAIAYSDNNGISWKKLTTLAGRAIKFHTLSTGRILTAGLLSIYYSDDNGEHWTQTATQLSGTEFTCFYSLPTGRVLAGSNTHGVWYSDDDGKHWTQATKTDGTWRAFCITSTGRILAAGAGTTYDNGIWYSDDGGANWGHIINTAGEWPSLCTLATGRILANKFNEGILYSDDNGTTWHYALTFNGRVYGFHILPTGYVITSTTADNCVRYSYPLYESDYDSKPLTKQEVLELVAECKAYVQSKKQS